MSSKRLAARAFLPATAVAAFVVLATAPVVTACGDSTGPGNSLCDRIHVDENGYDIDFVQPCNDFEGTTSSITYNDFGQVISFDFDVRCTTSSERYTGHVTLQYGSDHNTVIGWQATVNGQSCSGP